MQWNKHFPTSSFLCYNIIFFKWSILFVSGHSNIYLLSEEGSPIWYARTKLWFWPPKCLPLTVFHISAKRSLYFLVKAKNWGVIPSFSFVLIQQIQSTFHLQNILEPIYFSPLSLQPPEFRWEPSKKLRNHHSSSSSRLTSGPLSFTALCISHLNLIKPDKLGLWVTERSGPTHTDTSESSSQALSDFRQPQECCFPSKHFPTPSPSPTIRTRECGPHVPLDHTVLCHLA